MALDLRSGKLAGEVAGIDGARGIALVPYLNLGFATASKAESVFAFDLNSLKTVGQVKVGEEPEAILYDAFSGQVFAFNAKGNDASVIDPKALKVKATIQLKGRPQRATSDGAGTIYVTLRDRNAVAALDARSLKVLRSHSLAPCEEPSGIAMDIEARRLFVACGNQMAAMVDAHTGRILKTLPVGPGVDGAEFDSVRKLAFIPSSLGKLSIFRETSTSMERVQEAATHAGARTLALDQKTGRVLLAAADFAPPPAARLANGSSEGKSPAPGEAKKDRAVFVPNSFIILVMGQ
jgi:YVTN family beta-propeller protein